MMARDRVINNRILYLCIAIRSNRLPFIYVRLNFVEKKITKFIIVFLDKPFLII